MLSALLRPDCPIRRALTCYPQFLTQLNEGSRRLSSYLGTRTKRIGYFCREVRTAEYLP